MLEIEADLGGKPTTVLIKVLHPVLYLKSRIINMLHPATRRSDRVARTQAEATLVIVRCFINDVLNSPGDWREARDCFATIYWYLRSDPYVRVADSKLHIDPLDIIRAFKNDERIDARYRERQLQQVIANVERRRSRNR